MYNQLVTCHFFHPKNIYHADLAQDDNLVRVEVGEKALGEALVIHFACQKQKSIIDVLNYQVYGDPFLISGISYVSCLLMGTALEQAEAFCPKSLIEVLEIPPTKQFCAYLIEDAIKLAIEKWRGKYE